MRVRQQHGEIIDIDDFEKTETISGLKRKIYQKTKIAPLKQKLWMNKELLLDHKRIGHIFGDYILSPNTLVFLENTQDEDPYGATLGGILKDSKIIRKIIEYLSIESLLSLSLTDTRFYFIINYSEPSPWESLARRLKLNNGKQGCLDYYGKNVIVESLKIKDTKNVLKAAEQNIYNQRNNLKCYIKVEKMKNFDDFSIKISLVNEGVWNIKTPFYDHTHFLENFILYIYEESTREHLSTMTLPVIHSKSNSSKIILKPKESLVGNFNNVFVRNDLNDGVIRDLVFVVSSSQSSIDIQKHQTDVLLMETDTFTVDFWLKSAWKALTEEVWNDTRIISNALKTSEEFKNRRMELYNAVLG
ncbi:chromosome partition protein Smc [Acrasis kona]|uniref:Chromosome partition protein Smc n=1 Tax=Acrasis kona TaxID=1008807 RepID=A0AAW2ZJB5_9EUKA